jgi:hypothetical protein
MMSPVNLLPGAISEMFAQVSMTHRLTLADRYGLLAALLDEATLTDEERRALDRLLHALRKGRIQVVNDLSASGDDGWL